MHPREAGTLAVRLYGYLKERHKDIGLLVPLLKGNNLSNFILEVIPLNNNYDFRSEIVLEQYYLLDPSFNLNTVKVANNPSGSNACVPPSIKQGRAFAPDLFNKKRHKTGFNQLVHEKNNMHKDQYSLTQAEDQSPSQPSGFNFKSINRSTEDSSVINPSRIIQLNKEQADSKFTCHIFMYNRDKTILYYHSMKRKDFTDKLKIHYVIFEKHLEKGTYYLGKYLFSREYVFSAKYKEVSIDELISMLEKDREKFRRKY